MLLHATHLQICAHDHPTYLAVSLINKPGRFCTKYKLVIHPSEKGLKMYGIYPHIHIYGPIKRYVISFMLQWFIHEKQSSSTHCTGGKMDCGAKQGIMTNKKSLSLP